MKTTLLALPLLVIAAGCNSPDADLPQGTALVDAINSNAVSTKQVALSDQPDTRGTDKNGAVTSVNGDGAKAGITKVSSPANKGAKTGAQPAKGGNQSTPDAAYNVVDEANPGMSPTAVAALNKVKVPPPPASLKVPANVRMQLVTSKGPITVELNTTAAPLHSKSFYYLAQRGFFNGTVFHRFADLKEGSPEKGRIIQGGDPLTKDPKMEEFFGQGGPGYQIPRERNSLTHEKFVLAAARSSDPNSAGSQFYITIDPVTFLDEGDGYTVFGKVVAGQANAAKLGQGDKLTKVSAITAKQ